ncbi:NADPH-dependent F420 reductase [Leisingera sp. D0M16]|uniref:NADPH-dependent F420 reductase n=1 Tax=Leisingera coralii TaxID=3351347 RepID=UPI003B786355
MKIGIIGAGGIAKTYGKLWRVAGHQVMLSSRTADTRESAARSIGVQSGTPEEAAAFGDVVLLAVNYWTLEDAIARIAQFVTGKLVIDATNPLQYAEGGGVERVIAEDEIAGLVMARKLPAARIAKGFTTLWTGHVEKHADPANPKVAMTLAADDQADRAVLAALVRDAGLVPVDLGTLAQSRPLDPPSPIWNVVLTAEELAARLIEDQQASTEAEAEK